MRAAVQRRAGLWSGARRVISRERWAERQSGSKEIYPGIVRRRGRARPHARRHVAVWCVPARGTRHSDRPWSATRRAPDSLSALKHKFIGPGQTDAEEMVARSAGKRREIHVRLYWSLEMVPYRELLGAAAMTCRRRLAISGISEHRDTCRRLQWDRRSRPNGRIPGGSLATPQKLAQEVSDSPTF